MTTIDGNGARTTGASGGRKAPVALTALLLGGVAFVSAAPASAQPAVIRPAFQSGELLEFQVESSRFGRIGTARMSVEGPVELRGRAILVLSMDVTGRVFLIGFRDRTRSWFDPAAEATLRFEKEERHPLGRRTEFVEVFLEEGRWEEEGGTGGRLGASAPLDELSFIYFLRTLDLEGGTPLRLDRHFDEDRNPVRVRVVGTEVLTVPAGTFDALVVEMRVRDEERYGSGGNLIRIHFTRDSRRIPLRIESTAPRLGTVVIRLERISGAVPAFRSASSAPDAAAGAPQTREVDGS
jgi:hypothetical protein